MKLLRGVPFWAWAVVAIILAVGACQDVMRARCEDHGGRWVTGNVIDTCRERPSAK